MLTKAEVLLSKLQRTKSLHSYNKTRTSTEKALQGFSSYLNDLVIKHVRKDKSANHSYIIPSIYRDKQKVSNRVEFENYYRDTLSVANSCFQGLVNKIYDGREKVSHNDIRPYHDLIRAYIFDLKPYIEYLEQKENKSFTLFGGGKLYQVHPFELDKLSNSLYWDNRLDKESLDQRVSLNLSCFTIRQSLELRFMKALGVFRISNNDRSAVKLKHEFFPSFINKNRESFILPYNNLVDLMKIYSWTNKTIHSGISPKVWEVQYALKYIGPLFNSKRVELDGGKRVVHSLYGSIQIKNYESIKERLKNDIASTINREDFTLIFTNHPEAIILS